MSDEILENQNTEVPEEPTVSEETTQESAQPVHTEVELRAIEKGWRPQSEFSGDPTTFVDAGEFLRREPLFAKIAESSRRVKEMENLLRETIERNRKIEEKQREEELQSIAQRRQAAVQVADEEEFKRLDVEYDKKKQALQEVKQSNSKTEGSEFSEEDMKAFADFRTRNSTWCNVATEDNAKLVQMTDAAFTTLKNTLPGKSTAEYLKLAEAQIKATFPERFQNQAAQAAIPAVAAPSRAVTKADNLPAISTLTSQQREGLRIFKSAGGTEKEYLTQLKQLGRI